MVTTTTVYSFQKPDVSGDEDAWGGYLNANIDKYESILTGNTTITSVVITTADINGGTLDNVVIGGTTAAAVTGTTITGTGFVSSGNMTFGDNNKALFGAGSDLQIWHDATNNSIIRDAGAGDLFIQASANLRLTNVGGAETYAIFTENGAATLYYDNAVKITTASTGAIILHDNGNYDDGLTLRSTKNWGYGTSLSFDAITTSGGSNGTVGKIQSRWQSTGNHALDFYTYGGGSLTKRARLDNEGNLGVGGNTSPSSYNVNAHQLVIGNGSDSQGITIATGSNQYANIFFADGTSGTASYAGFIQYNHVTDKLYFGTSGSNRVVIDSTGIDISGDLNAVDNIVLATAMYHEGDTDTFLSFGSGGDSINLVTGGAARLSATNSGVQLGDTGNGYFQPVSGDYGSIQIDGGAHTGYEGYSIGGRIVLMHDNSNTTYLFNDVDNEAFIKMTNNGAVQLYHNGTSKIATTSTGIDVTGTVTADLLNVTSGSSADNIVQVFGGGTIYAGLGVDGTGAIITAGSSGSADAALIIKTSASGTETERLRISADGSVGIGTSSPNTALEVKQTSGTATIRVHADHESSPRAAIELMRGTSDTFGGDAYTDWKLGQVGGGSQADFAIISSDTTRGSIERLTLEYDTGNVGIGTNSPTGVSNYKVLHLKGGATNNGGMIRLDTSDGSTSGRIYTAGNMFLDTTTSSDMVFKTNNSEAMRINSNGDVGIGTTAPSSFSTYRYLDIVGGSTSTGGVLQLRTSNLSVNFQAYTSSVGGILGTTTNHGLIFLTNNSTRMVLDASGNLLLGKTAASSATVGFEAKPTGFMAATRDGDTVAVLNRKSSDGEILSFRKDGSSVGSIGSASGNRIYIGTGNSTLGFSPVVDAVYPFSGDDAVDLGTSSARFDDVYATNGTIQTSDRNEKQDIAELTDAEQRVAVAAKGLLRKFRWKTAVAEKGDEARTHFGIIAQDLQAAFAAEGLDAGDYAMFISSTWTDEETGEERTRMGVRYSELLAFIIAAI